MIEKACIHPDPIMLSPHRLAEYFAEVFSALDENPRELELTIELEESGYSIDLDEGEPVFRCEGKNSAHAKFRRRYLAEHAIPLTLRSGKTILRFIPTSGNRVKVRAK